MKTLAKLCFVIVLLANTYVVAQTTSVTLQVTDTDAQTWNNGTWTVDLTSAPGTTLPIGGPIVWTVGGSPVPNQHIIGNLSGTGGATMTLTQNAVIVPVGSIWNFNVCPQASSGCYNQQVTIAGASQTVTLHPPAIRIASPTPYTLAYADNEIVNPPIAGQYYNLVSTTQRQWNGSLWQNVGGGGGLPSGCTSGGTGQVTCNVSLGVTGTPPGQIVFTNGTLPTPPTGSTGVLSAGSTGAPSWSPGLSIAFTSMLIGDPTNGGLYDVDNFDTSNGVHGFGSVFAALSVFQNCQSLGWSSATNSSFCSDLTLNQQSVSSYSYTSTDQGHVIQRTSAGAMTDTLPAPSGTMVGPFSFYIDATQAGGIDTVTAQSSTINNSGTLQIIPGSFVQIYAGDTSHWYALVVYAPSGVVVVN